MKAKDNLVTWQEWVTELKKMKKEVQRMKNKFLNSLTNSKRDREIRKYVLFRFENVEKGIQKQIDKYAKFKKPDK